MADIKKIIEAVEYCLTNGKCTECKFSKGRMFATCRYLMEDIFELLKEQQQIIRCKDCKHRDPEDHKCDCGHDIQWQLPRSDNWFCADGKHKET